MNDHAFYGNGVFWFFVFTKLIMIFMTPIRNKCNVIVLFYEASKWLLFDLPTNVILNCVGTQQMCFPL